MDNSPPHDANSPPENPDAEYSGLIFILKNTTGQLRVAENFLSNRKWTVSSSTNLRETLAFILSKKPEIVMIASDHPNKKARVLPKILMQANLPLKIIGYTESQTSSAIAALHEMGCAYTLYPPISGPSIERMILKIRKDEENKDEDSSFTLSASPSHGSVDLRSDEINDSFENAKKVLAGLVSDDEDEEDNGSSSLITIAGSKTKGHGVFLDKGQRAKQFKATAGSEEGPGGVFTAGAEKKGTPHFLQSDETAGEYDAVWDDASSDPQPSPKISKTVDVRTKQNFKETNDSIIVRGTQEALEQAVAIKRGRTDIVENLENVSNAACIVVDSPKFKGYLVAALGKNRSIDNTFLSAVKERLFTFLRSHGELVNEEDPVAMDIKIEQVPFEDWAIEQAQFLKKSVHGGNEIALAFFPADETRSQLEESISDRMLKMNMNELKDDTSVEFDLYIYMPENNKYLLYTPQGKMLYKDQKLRLQEKGVTHMHLRKDSVAAVKKYRVQNFLNDKIEQYRISKKA